jgi:uncharacterized membrane protein YkvA (DUF1232 family)
MPSDKRAKHDDDKRNGRQSKGRSPGIRRMIAAAAFMPLAGRAPLYARLIWSLITDERVPIGRKALLGGALGYVALGRDIVPDRVPLLGQLDDLVVVALAIDVFVDGLDEELVAEKLELAGIPRAAYDEDVARVRRLVPSPIRRAARRIPDGVRFVAEAVDQTGLPNQLRRWLTDARDGVASNVASRNGASHDGELRPSQAKQIVEGSIA